MKIAAPARYFKLQFGLRALLLLMLFVGVGLAYYRWPQEWGNSESLRTVRRNWNGEWIQHGLEISRDHSTGYVRESWYEEGRVRAIRSWHAGVVIEEKRIRNGKLHGHCWSQEDYCWSGGEYRNGQKYGDWREERADVVICEQWQDDQLHGLRSWTTPVGRVLQTAEYDQGRLVQWNGQPVEKALQDWLVANVDDVPLRAKFFERLSEPPASQAKYAHYREYLYSVGTPPQQFVVHWDWRQAYEQFRLEFPEVLTLKKAVAQERPFGVVLLEYVLSQSNTFAYRFQRLTIVPITPIALDWQDRTGVNDVHFEAGSGEEKFWMAGAAAEVVYHWFPGARFRAMFNPQQNQPPLITVDISNLNESEWITGSGSRQRPIPRIRRDLFAQHLDEVGCYVEQQGNMLIIKPHPHFQLAPIAQGQGWNQSK